ncbi:MAG: hypothetical protein D6748_15680 [Calditrichaeota bacterium]|nr:MAG: hypothetical protein D6748_15680 [Calditrichota bacterium]
MSSISFQVIWIYSPDEHLRERYIFEEKKQLFAEDNMLSVARGEIEFFERYGQIFMKIEGEPELLLSDKTIIIAHNYDSIIGIQDVINRGFEVLDYSSSDGAPYEEMLNDFEEVSDKEHLIDIVNKWINFYRYDFKLDPIRRIKHRALNLFSHILVDLQTIKELCETHDFGQLVKVIEDIRTTWEKPIHGCNSPSDQLAKLQYLLVGNEEEKKNTNVLLLSFRGKGRSLYHWLEQLPKHASYLTSSEWENLLCITGLASQEDKTKKGITFIRRKDSSIFNLCDEVGDTITNASDVCKKINNLHNKFSAWITQLTDALDCLEQTIKS